MNEIQNRKTGITIEDILTLGETCIEKIRQDIQNTTLKVNQKDNSNPIVQNLNDILMGIDYEELTLDKVKKRKGFMSVIDMFTDKSKSILDKYTDISYKLNNMYKGVIQWCEEIKHNNQTLMEMKEVSISNVKLLEECITQGQKMLELFNGDKDLTNIELRTLLETKIQDFHYMKAAAMESIGNITILISNNYAIYTKMLSVYNTTLPVIQSQINTFIMLKEQKKHIQSIEIIDKKRDELIEFGAKESVEIGKQSVSIIGNNQRSFQVIGESIKQLKQGIEDINSLKEQRILDIKNTLIGGVVFEKLEG